MSNAGDSTSRVSAARELVGVQVLVVDQDITVQKGVTALLSAAGLHVTSVSTPEQALSAIERQFYSVILVDIDTPTPGAGIATIRGLKEQSSTSMVIAMTPRRSFEDSVTAVRAGAIDLILKAPDSVAYLKDRVVEAAGRSVGRREVDSVMADVKQVYDDFLLRFVESERRAVDLADRLAGRDPDRALEVGDLQVLIVDEVETLYDAMIAAAPPGYAFTHATSGGEALDRASSGHYHYAMVAEDIGDLPASILVRSIKTQNPELVVLTFLGPSENGRVDLVETSSVRTIVTPFRETNQLVDRLDELAQAWRAKARERRYTTAFRERHYDFLRRYVELKTKIDRAMHEGGA